MISEGPCLLFLQSETQYYGVFDVNETGQTSLKNSFK